MGTPSITPASSPASRGRPRIWALALLILAPCCLLLFDGPRDSFANVVWPSQRSAAAQDIRADTARAGAGDRAPVPGAAASSRALASADPSARGRPEFLTGIVLDPAGQPVAGAECRVAPGRSSTGFTGSAGAGSSDEISAGAAAVSDAAGAFSVPAARGPWSLTVAAAGFALYRQDQLQPGDYVEVRLADAFDLVVAARSALGEPVSGADLRVGESFRELDGPSLATGATSADGTCVLGGLPRGSWYLSARHPDFQLVHRELEIGGEPLARVDLVLAPGIRVVGAVRSSAASAPLEHASVRIEAYSKGQSLIVDLDCGPDGSFATERLYAPGEVLAATASASGFAETTAWLAIDATSGAGEQRIEIDLASAEHVVRGRAVDASGRVAPGAAVLLTSIPPVARGREALQVALARITPHSERWRRAATADGAGRFEIRGLAPERQYVLLLAAEPYAHVFVWPPVGAAGEITELGDVLLDTAGSLLGYARYADGAPAAAREVRAQLEIIVDGSRFDGWRPSQWWRPYVVRTRPDGSFRFDSLAAGRYDLWVDGTAVGSYPVAGGAPTGPIQLALAGDAPSSLAAEGRLTGSIRSEAGGPLANAFVALFAADPAATGDGAAERKPAAMTFSDIGGAFALGAPLGAAYELLVIDIRAEHVEHRELLPPLEARASIDVRLSADPDPAPPLVGRVLGPDGAPLGGLEVSLELPENRYCGCLSLKGKTDENGLVTFERLARKEHRVRVSDPSGRFLPQEHFPARAGEYFELVLSY